jgi:RNA polymerase sigma-70 factor (ECF subfamily)
LEDDFELLDKWRGGDSVAGDALFRRHFARIYRFFRSKVGADAEDLTQRTFLACVESRERMAEDSNFRAYVFGVARNQLLMHYRRAGRGSAPDPERQSVRQLGHCPALGLEKGEELRLVLAAMQNLPIDFQVALELYYWEDMEVVHIAQVLELPEGTVKSRLHRGRERLREEITKAAGSDALAQSTLQALNDWIKLLREQVPAGSEEDA